MARAAVVAEVAVAVANRDGSAVAATRGIGLELGELLVAVRRGSHGGAAVLQSPAGRLHHDLRSRDSRCERRWQFAVARVSLAVAVRRTVARRTIPVGMTLRCVAVAATCSIAAGAVGDLDL